MVEAAGIEPDNIPLFPFRSPAFIGLVMRFFVRCFCLKIHNNPFFCKKWVTKWVIFSSKTTSLQPALT